jgi:hypothetical protein
MDDILVLPPPSPGPVTRHRDMVIHHTRISQSLQIVSKQSRTMQALALDPLFHPLLSSLLMSANSPTLINRPIPNPPHLIYLPCPPLAHKLYNAVEAIWSLPPHHSARDNPSHLQR